MKILRQTFSYSDEKLMARKETTSIFSLFPASFLDRENYARRAKTRETKIM